MAHRFLFLSLMVFGFALGAASAAPTPAPKITPSPAYPGGLGCQKDTGAAAWIAPCTGPEGTVITIYPQVVLTSPPDKLVFSPDFPIPGGSHLMHEILKVTGPGFTLKAPKELCVYPPSAGAYSRTWDVAMLTADGKNKGRVGVYTMKCGPGATPSPSVTAAPAPPAKCGSAGGAGAAISPCAGPPGTRIGIYPLHVLHDPLNLLRFERVPGSACYAPACGPTVVLVKIVNDGKYYVSAPAELCVYGPKWSTFAFGKAGTAFGLAGLFTIDCHNVSAMGPAAGYSTECGPTSKLVSISPCAGPVGTSIKVGKSKTLAGKPAAMAFRKAGSAGGPLIILAIKGSSAVATAALCPPGPKFTVSILDPGGIDFGDAGTFTIICSPGGGGGGGKATPKPTASPSPTPTPKKTPKPKVTKKPMPQATSTPKPQGTQVVFAPHLPNPTASPSPKPTATPSPKPTPTAAQGTCVPTPNSPIKLGTCNLFDTEMVQMTLVGTSQLSPAAVVFQLQGSTAQPLTAPVQPNMGGGFTFIVPVGICRHVPAQWALFATGPGGQVPIGLFNTNC